MDAEANGNADGRIPLGGNSVAGFTFLELLVVVTMIAILTAGVTPMFAGSLSGARGSRSVRDLVASFRYAGEMAIIEELEYRVYINDDKGIYWIARETVDEDGETVFRPVSTREGEIQRFPADLKVARVRANRERLDNEQVYYVRFFPGGACDFAEIRLERSRRDRIDIAINGALGKIKVDE